jgi:hypothetical protein
MPTEVFGDKEASTDRLDATRSKQRPSFIRRLAAEADAPEVQLHLHLLDRQACPAPSKPLDTNDLDWNFPAPGAVPICGARSG